MDIFETLKKPFRKLTAKDVSNVKKQGGSKIVRYDPNNDPLKRILFNISVFPDSKVILNIICLGNTNSCLVSHLIFHYLSKSNNAENISSVISSMVKSSGVRSKLREFPWNCLGLPQMILALNRCCTIFKEEDKLEFPPHDELSHEEVLKIICKNSLELFYDMLFPLMKHTRHLEQDLERIRKIEALEKRYEELRKFDDDRHLEDEANRRVLKITEQILNMFTDILQNFEQRWPGELKKPLEIFCKITPLILTEKDLQEVTIKESLQRFVNQIPVSLKTFRNYADEWKGVVQLLCSHDGPDGSCLCRIWLLLVKISIKKGYLFLGDLLKETVTGMLLDQPVDGKILRVNPDTADVVTGAINDLFMQCKTARSEDRALLDLYIKPELSGIITRYGDVLEPECVHMYSYLNNMMSMIEGMEQKTLENERAQDYKREYDKDRKKRNVEKEKGRTMKARDINIYAKYVNIADEIGKIVYEENYGIGKEDFEELKEAIGKMSKERLADLGEMGGDLVKAKTEDEKTTMVEKIKAFLIENGVPIAQGLTAAGIFEIVKALI